MEVPQSKIRILFFIGSLRSGGKERRLVELLSYLKNTGKYEMMVILTLDEIHYKAFHDLAIPYQVLGRVWSRYDLSIFYRVYAVAKEFKPDIIHSWGSTQTFYALPTVLAQKVDLINSQITSAPPHIKKWSMDNFIDKINFYFSKIILSNSRAGIEVYNPPLEKSKVIYNGINLNRFRNLPSSTEIKAKYGITTPYAIVMAASLSPNKDYQLFYQVAKLVNKTREDVTFIGVGWYLDDSQEYQQIRQLTHNNHRILFGGRINDVEALVNACDIGVLFSNRKVHGEGISNAIMEYMALSKPVVANDAGGTKEILRHNENGFLITNQQAGEIANMIIELLDDATKKESFGKRSREIIESHFTLETMGVNFEKMYQYSLLKESNVLQTSPVCKDDTMSHVL